MDTSIIEAFWHAPHRLFGRKLKPLSLRHCFVLATAANPLIEGGMVTRADLIQAVEICSRDAEFFLSGKKPSWFRAQVVAFRAPFENAALEKFRAYLDDYCTGPQVWASEDGKKAKSHWTISIVAGLGHWVGVQPKDAWNMTPGEANWILAAAIEQSPHGTIDIAGEGEFERIKKLVEENAEEGRAA